MNRSEELPSLPADRPDVLIVSASVGAGHNQAARSVLAVINESYPDIKTQWIDVLNYCRPGFRKYYAGGYALAVSRLPRLYGLGYRFTDRGNSARRSIMERRRLFTEKIFTRKYLRLVDELRPPVILHTHFMAPPMLGRLPLGRRSGIKQVVAVTDYHLHRWWYSENIDMYFVPSEQGYNRLQNCGVAPENITLSSIAVHPRWKKSYDRPQLRQQWSLPLDAPVVILSGGVDFTLGDISTIAHELLSSGPQDLHVIVLAGANKRLAAELAESEYAKNSGRLRVMGFTDRNHELISLSDLVITKAGGLTTTECLSVGRAMVILPPLPGQEAANARHMQQLGAALTADSAENVIALTRQLLGNSDVLSKMSAASAAAGNRCNAAVDIASYVCSLADKSRGS